MSIKVILANEKHFSLNKKKQTSYVIIKVMDIAIYQMLFYTTKDMS